MNFTLKSWRSTPLILLVVGILVSLTLSPPITKRPTTFPHPYTYSFTTSSLDRLIPNLESEIAFFQQRIQQHPEDGLERAALAQTYLKMARATGNSSWYLLAENAARQSLANLPFDNSGATLVLAQIAEARHNFPDGIILAEQLLQTQADNPDALGLLVTAHLATGNIEAASLAANRLVEQIPTLNSLTLRALVNLAQGQEEAALKDFQAALAAEEPGEASSSAKTRTLLGRFYAQSGETALAKELYQEALRIFPQYPFALLQLADLETQLGNYPAATQFYSQVAFTKDKANIYDHSALLGLAQVKELQGDRDAAEALWEKAENLFRQHQEIDSFGHRRELARLLLSRANTEDLDEALALMQAEVQIRRDAQTLDTLAWVLSRLGRYQEAQQVIQEALARGIQNPAIVERAAKIEQNLGNKQ